MKKYKVNWHHFIECFILIPFLNPRGFYEVFPIYKAFMTGWMYLSLLLILFEVCMRYRGFLVHIKKNAEVAVFAYFIAMLLITVIVQGGLHEGLQNMIATPLLCLYGIVCMRKESEIFLQNVSVILLVIFILNLTVFNPYMMQYKIASYHVIFLGHVQVAGQFGMLGVLCGCLLYMTNKGRLAIWLIMTSALTMLTSGTASTILVLALMILLAVLYQLKIYEIFCKGIGTYVVLFALLSAGLVMINSALPDKIINVLNSRHQIWNVAMEEVKKAPLIGYGVQGVTLKMYWGSSLNYAHSQFAQNLLDGGILLCVIFYIMVFCVALSIRKVQRRSVRVLGTLALISYLCISMFESVSFYPYFGLTLIFLLYLPEFSENSDRNAVATCREEFL